ncbi:GGDEF domain-containing protein [Roseateles flavus]|uniref:diguanylate cyclase n=1 Tax=Roseateles flavus TaxID=3149041 RepID=A0ABV0GLS1_9BURK
MDPRTSILIGSITCGLMALVLTVLARATPLPVPGMRRWVLGSWLVFLALLLLGLRDWITNLGSVTLGNGALILAYIVWLSGTLEYGQRRIRWVPWLLLSALVTGTVTWFVYVDESYRARVVIVAGLCAVINARHAFVVMRMLGQHQRSKALGTSLTTTWLAVLTVVYASRALHAIALPQGNSGLLTQDAIQILYTGGFTVCNLMLVIAFATLASDHVRARIEEQVVRDPLTGALNRRALFEALELELQRSRRYGRKFCIAMLDIDHFKKVNDQFGHLVGDRVLASTCRRATSLIRPNDVFARYGGEEFLILMPETTLESAMQAAERIRGEIGSNADDNLPCITVSMGVTEWCADDVSAESMVARADSALYVAKANGRNRIEIAGS